MVDVLVIGGGIAGVSIAYELAADVEVLLVEAEPELALHTTGRSAAIYAPSYGGPVVRALTTASGPLFGDGILTPRPTLWIAVDDEGVAELRRLAVEPLTTAQAVALCPVLRTPLAAAVDRSAMDIDVMALHARYVSGLRARGGTIRRNTRVTELHRQGDGWVVDDIHARTVVDAAGAWVDQVAELAGVPTVGLRPMRRTIALAHATADPAWPLVTDALDRFYFRAESGHLLVSPGDATPSEPCDAKPDDLDVATAIERVNAVTTLGLRSVHTAWAGLRSFVADGEPLVGAWPDHPGFVFFAGQGGYGIQMAPALARTGADIVLGRPSAFADHLAPTATRLRWP
ncbi:NAD(P)/FAD-dependent oxidoreductase [Actinophytocola oryzae]|uniref:D-arginine dehydrogenase n=1 Tax=Actinophytocola oryzae TaxID=502181 RepID=A0A4R7UWV0_9PSEU|nr:FAD-dependent oxidoreductase [Actinophytocola oryzae]TDV40472.1 D-arginine dehydrogenase [Actinophytocola oryzae]